MGTSNAVPAARYDSALQPYKPWEVDESMAQRKAKAVKSEPKQKTKTGVEIPIPKRADVERDLAKLVSDAKPLRPRGRKT
jgi:hypothetical protein